MYNNIDYIDGRDTMDYTEKQLHSELIFDGKVLHLYRDDIL
jgi:hypothetical protein